MIATLPAPVRFRYPTGDRPSLLDDPIGYDLFSRQVGLSYAFGALVRARTAPTRVRRIRELTEAAMWRTYVAAFAKADRINRFGTEALAA